MAGCLLVVLPVNIQFSKISIALTAFGGSQAI
jgi:hypothetical protein